MEKNRTITLEHLLYGLIFAGALLVRVAFLGRIPLLETEAGWAYQAFQISRGEAVSIGSQVGYLAVTEALFSLFKGSDFLARFWPALAGSFAVGIAFLLRKRLGSLTALVLAAGLAFDPGLVAVSRTAGGAAPAFVFLGLALAAAYSSRFSWALFFTGLGLLSGPDFWFGILLAGVCILAGRLTGLLDSRWNLRQSWVEWKGRVNGGAGRLLLPLIIIGILGTFFLTNYQGLTAWVGAAADFLSSWLQPGGVSPLKMPLTLLISSPFALVFGTLGFVSSWWQDRRQGKLLSVWFAAVLLIVLIYPGRQPGDLIWVALPLWLAAAEETVRISKFAPRTWVTYTLGGMVAVLFSLNWLTFTGLVFQVADNRAVYLQLGLLGASVALVVLSMTIVGSEWDWKMAWKGLAVGSGAVLVLFMISSLSLDAFLWEKDPRSLFAEDAGPGQMDLLRESISDASLTLTGRPDSIQGVVLGGTDLLRWTLRDYSGIAFSDTLRAEEPAPLLITQGEVFGAVDGELYRGQDFVLSSRPGWTGLLPSDWISWIGYRFGPIERDHLILWIRNDIYSGY